MSGITGAASAANLSNVGERIYNFEKVFNYREGFTRADDVIPDRFLKNRSPSAKNKGRS